MPSTPASSSASPSAAPARATADVWDGLADQLAEVARLARSSDSAEAFYSELMRSAVTALAAEGGAVWTPASQGAWRQLVVIQPASRPTDPQARDAHQKMLAKVVLEGTARSFAARSKMNPAPHAIAVAPVPGTHQPPGGLPPAVLEVALPIGASPATYQGAQDLLAALADIAAEFHALRELARLKEVCESQNSLLALTERVHRKLDLPATAAAIVNESRKTIGCDRVSLVATRNGQPRLLAVSGVDRPDRRSRTLRAMQRVAGICHKLGDPLFAGGDQTDALPQTADALQEFVDLSSARQVAFVPMTTGVGNDQQPHETIGVLVAESYAGHAQTVARERVTEAALACAPALRNALEVESVPLFGLLRGVRGLARPSRLLKLALATAAACAAVAALMLVPAELRVEARGELQPVVRQNVFAPNDGIVQELLVGHGQQVKRGEPLAVLRNPQLDLEIKRIDGELSTTRRQLESVKATRTSIDPRGADAAEAYRLSAEEQQLAQRITAMQQERELLAGQRDELTINSPLNGMVLTWQADLALRSRPVERGQLLLTVADTQGDWRVELDLPDDRIGHLKSAEQSSADPLTVEYRLGSEESGFRTGKVERIADRAEEPTHGAAPGAQRTVTVLVTPYDSVASTSRPGASVRARVLCGERSLGYVWLHDLVDTLRVWWEF